jgi:para-nitrobenzyl esterase
MKDRRPVRSKRRATNTKGVTAMPTRLSIRPTWFAGSIAVAAMMVSSMAAASSPTVTTSSGLFPSQTYAGVAGNGISDFLGIRFAAAPTGSLRFAPPVAPAAVSGTVSASSFGPPCPQSASPFGVASSNEDCLFLNVYVPGSSVSSRSNMPVMVFFYGGAFVDGEGSIYDPTSMATQGDVIVVTVNYRLGILGYLASTALSKTSANGVSGNYGFEDQLFALQWVKQNIGAFGGNPNNVTIFGESAGAFSVCAAIVSPKAAGLFQRAVAESGPCAEPLPELAGAESSNQAIVSGLGCADSSNQATVACLRAAPVSSILAEQSTITNSASLASLAAFFPVVDGDFIPEEPILSIALSDYNHVPIIEGTNANEGRLFVALAFDLNPAVGKITTAQYPTAIQAIAAALITEESGLLASTGNMSAATSSSSNSKEEQTITNEILHEYPLSNFGNSPGEALGAVLTDGLFACTANISNELLSLEVPTFAYEFNDTNVPTPELAAASFPYGATHTDELQFLFTLQGDTSSMSSAEQTLASTMRSYWTTFAHNGNPNSGATANWPAFSLFTDDTNSLNTPRPSVEFDYATEHHCNFWIDILLGTILESIASELTSAGITE